METSSAKTILEASSVLVTNWFFRKPPEYVIAIRNLIFWWSHHIIKITSLVEAFSFSYWENLFIEANLPYVIVCHRKKTSNIKLN